MNKGVIIAAVAVLFLAGFLTAGFVAAADAPAGGEPLMKGQPVKTLKGRVWAQWADNPERELLLAFNTGTPVSRPLGPRVDGPRPIWTCGLRTRCSCAARGASRAGPRRITPMQAGTMLRRPCGCM